MKKSTLLLFLVTLLIMTTYASASAETLKSNTHSMNVGNLQETDHQYVGFDWYGDGGTVRYNWQDVENYSTCSCNLSKFEYRVKDNRSATTVYFEDLGYSNHYLGWTQPPDQNAYTYSSHLPVYGVGYGPEGGQSTFTVGTGAIWDSNLIWI